MADQLELLAAWINAEIDKNEIYHNHKETMAWTATAIWLAASAYVVVDTPSWFFQARVQFSFIYLLLAVYGTFAFANVQFSMRWVAADRSVALRRALMEVCRAVANVGVRPALSNTRLRVDPISGFPELVGEHLQDRVRIEVAHRGRLDFVRVLLPLAVFRWGRERIDPRWRSEAASYAALVIATVAVMWRIWIDP